MFVSGEIRNDDFSKRRIYKNDINKKNVLVGDVFGEYLLITLHG